MPSRKRSTGARDATGALRIDVPPGKYMLERVCFERHRVVDADFLSFEELGPFICAGGWTATVFTGKQHRKKHFRQHSGVLVLDFDEGLSLDAARERFRDYRHIIGVTKSHQQVKNSGTGSEKPPCDRFRVLLFAERPAVTVEELEATNQSLFSWNPEADRSCLHGAVVWSPCREVVAVNPGGRLVPIASVGLASLLGTSAGAGPLGIDSSPDLPAPGRGAAPTDAVLRGAIAFLKATRPSVSGQHGHDRLFRAAATLVKEFGVVGENAVDLLWKHFNPRCRFIDGSPCPWSTAEIRHKVRDAERSATHQYGHGVNKPWDVRWKCCPMLVDLLDRLRRGDTVRWSLYAPGIEPHARAALERRRVTTRTTKRRVDRHWVSELVQFLEGAPQSEFDASYLLRTALGRDAPTQGEKTRLGRAMGALGWNSKRVRVGGRPVQRYVRPVPRENRHADGAIGAARS